MKKLFALTIILGIILCAVCATSFSAERIIGQFHADDDQSFSRAVGDMPRETIPEPTEETQIDETRVMERVIETLTTDETVTEDETTVVPTEAETVAETAAETTVEPTTIDETETPATVDTATPGKPHRNAVKTGDNTLLFIGVGLLIVAMIALLISMKKKANSYDK